MGIDVVGNDELSLFCLADMAVSVIRVQWWPSQIDNDRFEMI